MFGNDPFILLDDAREKDAAPSRLYRDPIATIEASSLDTLDAGLAQISEARQSGHHVAGYISYEAGLALEQKLTSRLTDDLACPLLWFGVFKDYQEMDPQTLAKACPDPEGAWLGPLEPQISRADYDVAFDAVQEYIQAGDIYQANLTFSAIARFSGHPMALYAAIRDRARAGYGGVVFDGRNWMLSFSPELFFARKGNRITARPMKGTAARHRVESEDAKVREQLRKDPKQRAENLMIVDLLRNDLSRIAKPGTVQVPELFHVESYPTIHQMTSTVTADLDDMQDVSGLLRQMFPCGSITGAPKIRAMEIIDQLEATQRGIYCGSIGRIDANGDAAFNVAIRTFFLSADQQAGQEKLSIGLGSGIVADSKCDDEWQECLAKGRFAAVHDINVDLMETMAFDPANGIARLEAHLERMKTSAAALEFEFDRHAARNTLHAVTFHQEQSAKVRMMLSKSGALAIELQPMPAPLTEPANCKLVPMEADKADYRLHHKTSDRRIYNVSGLEQGEHPIFVDAGGFVTGGAIWNVFVERDGK
ncbi:aminodeoxychorismate synthase component I, partial [Parasphingorhabdus sp.]|uniref:aminodeoxychorismate synthase component I n=1 Tax=Parasphingorhabdus sp. TaxID=2709688 RepID=UPI0032998B13